MSERFELPGNYVPVAQRSVESRSAFITRTYNHLMGAIVAFTLFEVWLFSSGLAQPIASALMSGSWLMVLGGFMFLCEFDPDEIYRWFMEMFVDSYDWVMVPNVYAMSQSADGQDTRFLLCRTINGDGSIWLFTIFE